MSNSGLNLTLHRARRADDARASGHGFLLALFGAFAALMLVALLVGLQGYRTIVDDQNSVDEQRLAYGTLVNTVKAFDSVDALSLGEYEGNDLLSMTQRTNAGTYVTALYVHDGMLMQQYMLPDAALAPESANALFATSTFKVAYEDSLLTFTTDEANPCVRLVCPQPLLASELERRAASAEAGDA